jgi:beta-1,4-mannosyltransferase
MVDGRAKRTQGLPPRIVVLESTRPPDGTTRYIDQVVTHAPPHFEFRYFSPRAALRRADVFHVHWPEVIVRGGNPMATALRCLFLRFVLRLMRSRRTAIVRTLHNLSPHEPGSALERSTLDYLDALTDLFVTINPVTVPPSGPSTLIPHGHYRDRFASHPKRETVPGRLVYAGLIRPYKQVDRLIECFRETKTPGLTLRIAGKPTPELQETIELAAQSDHRITARFGFLPDDEFVAEVTSAELVCLPYSELHNSGILLVALSLGRPVLVPDSATTRALSEEVGPGWVHRFQGHLDPADIDAAVEAVRSTQRTAEPRLDDRDWTRVADLYGKAFVEAIQRRTNR